GSDPQNEKVYIIDQVHREQHLVGKAVTDLQDMQRKEISVNGNYHKKVQVQVAVTPVVLSEFYGLHHQKDKGDEPQAKGDFSEEPGVPEKGGNARQDAGHQETREI